MSQLVRDVVSTEQKKNQKKTRDMAREEIDAEFTTLNTISIVSYNSLIFSEIDSDRENEKFYVCWRGYPL